MIPIFGPDDIRPELSIEALIPSAEQALRAISDGTAQAPVYVLYPNDQADIHVKSAVLPNCPIFTVKMAGWSQILVDRGEPASSGMIAVFDSETCKPIAILQDDHLISDYRTAAAGAVVARLLAPETAQSALIVGTGMQAHLQAEALLLSRDIKRVHVWGRDIGKADALCEKLAKKFPKICVHVTHDLAVSVPSADVIVTATGAREPIIQADWIRAGQHITSVGSDDATKCEIAPSALSLADVYVDAQSSGEAYGVPHRAISKGLIQPGDLTEIGLALESGIVRTDSQTTIACLSGLGIQDLTAIKQLFGKLTFR